MDFNEKDYIKGFNEGYMLAEFLPELSDKIAENANTSDHFIGIQDGRHQFILDQMKDRLPDWLTNNRVTDKDNRSDKTQEKEIDDFETRE